MTEQQFVYWLQGFAELNDQPPSAEQWQSIREHLALVFNKVTPPVKVSVNLPESADEQVIRSMIERASKRGESLKPVPQPYQPFFLDQSNRSSEAAC